MTMARGSALNISYAYSPTQNNGKITSQSDIISGEQIAYTYDALNRLASAQTTQTGGTQWGQSYTYDGFGNLTDQTVIKGSAPDVHVAYNYLTNRQTGDTADANGNIGSGYIYDLDNRLVQPGSSSTVHYGYDVTNKRIWRGDSSSGLDEITFWAGQKLATYQVSSDSSYVYFALTSTNVSFGGKLISKGTYNSSGTGDMVTLAPIVADRLGSTKKFYPFGTERPSATANDTDKFTGYFRDASTGLDYADQRYHQPGVGRFMTPDPKGSSAQPNGPGSWNRYAYVQGDPINSADPSGLYPDDDPFDIFPVLGGGGGSEDQGPGIVFASDVYLQAAAVYSSGVNCPSSSALSAFASSTDYWYQAEYSICSQQPTQTVANVPCEVEVGYVPVFTKISNYLPGEHTFIYDLNSQGVWNVVDAGPTTISVSVGNCGVRLFPVPCKPSVNFGPLKTAVSPGGLYGENTNPASTIYWASSEPCSLVDALNQEASNLNGAVPYHPIGIGSNWYNSNSFIYTLVTDFNLPVGKPPTSVFDPTPGWGNYIPH